jgi:hypothetical protein
MWIKLGDGRVELILHEAHITRLLNEGGIEVPDPTPAREEQSMAVRSTMSSLIALVRTMIADPAGASQQFDDQAIQDRLDSSRDDIRYESLLLRHRL